MAISLTEKAAEHVLNFIEKRGGAAGLRLAVKTSGCSGLAYVLEFVDEIDDTDEVFLIYLDGTELDYKREGLNEGFEFNNPNVKDACGCGESFTV